MPPRLLVPPRVARELLDERQKFAQCIVNACHEDAVCADWNRELQRIDPLLRMVKAPEFHVIGMPLVPGYYHLVRDNPTTFPSVTPVRGPDGEFRVPGVELLEQLKRTDLQNARVTAMHGIEQERVRRADEKAKRDRRETRQGHILERWKAISRAQISMNDSVPWAQNSAGEKRTRGNRKKDAA